MNNTNKKLLILIYLLVFLLFISLGFILYLIVKDNTLSLQNIKLFSNLKKTQQNESKEEDPFDTGVSYTILLKENTNDKTKTDVYLKSDSNNEETLYMTIADVYGNHYHPAEFINGFLYIIKRIGYDNYRDDDWTDELWRYNKDKEGEKIFIAKGLDFKISEDENIIAIETNEFLSILNKEGTLLKQFDTKDLIVGDTSDPLINWSITSVTKDFIWVQSGYMGSLDNLLKISTIDYSQTEYILNIGSPFEYSFNSEKEIVAYSDFPTFYDADSYTEYKESDEKVTLYLYDLNTEEIQTIATSVAQEFAPEWINVGTLQYDNPTGGGTLTKTVF